MGESKAVRLWRNGFDAGSLNHGNILVCGRRRGV